jgi:hypothetical protein
MSIILPPPPPQEKDKNDEEAFLSFIRERFQNADPIAKQKFADMIEGVDFEVSPTKAIEEDQEQSYFVEEDSKEFGITYSEYQFLLGDIEQAIEDANRKYGYGEAGYIDEVGDFCPFPDNDKPNRIKDRRLSTEEVAIARGIIKVHRPEEIKKEGDI